jgi:hypothetical protein
MSNFVEYPNVLSMKKGLLIIRKEIVLGKAYDYRK